MGGQPPGRVWGSGSSGHPVDGSAQVVEEEGGLCSSFQSTGFVAPTTPGPVFGHVAERARLVEKKMGEKKRRRKKKTLNKKKVKKRGKKQLNY